MTDRTTPQEASRAAFEAKTSAPLVIYEAHNKGTSILFATMEAAQCMAASAGGASGMSITSRHVYGWQAATKARDAQVAALRDALAQVLSDLEIGAHPHLHIDQIRAVLRAPQQ